MLTGADAGTVTEVGEAGAVTEVAGAVTEVAGAVTEVAGAVTEVAGAVISRGEATGDTGSSCVAVTEADEEEEEPGGVEAVPTLTA